MSATGSMDSPPGEGVEAPSGLLSATNGGGGSGLGGSAGGFECSLELDEQLKNISYFYCLFYKLDATYMTWLKEHDSAWGEAVIERLRTDPRVDVETFGLRKVIYGFWEGATALHVAVMAGDIKMVEKILEPDFVRDIDGRSGMDKSEYTALHLAAAGGNVSIVDALLRNGADPMLVDKWKRTILHAAVNGGHQHVVKRISGRYPSLLNARDECLRTPLHWAICGSNEEDMAGVVKSLCQCQDIDVKALDMDGFSAFYYAVWGGKVEVVLEMLDCCKDKIRLNEACFKELGPPIQIAFQCHHKDIEIALMECDSVKGYVETLYRDRQVYVDSANAILVGAALIASVTFGSWLQPPLNYTSYFGGGDGSAMLTPSSSSLDYADVEHNVGLRVFWVFNALSFYFAMATVVCGAATVIPRTGVFIKEAVEKLARSLLWTSMLLAFSVVFVIIAFAIAGSIVVTPLLKYQWYMIGPTMVGGLVCILSLVYLFKVVLENTKVGRRL